MLVCVDLFLGTWGCFVFCKFLAGKGSLLTGDTFLSGGIVRKRWREKNKNIFTGGDKEACQRENLMKNKKMGVKFSLGEQDEVDE